MEKKLAEEKMSELHNYLAKHCLWQFNSRGWDRLIQNERIIENTTKLLCGEEVNIGENYYADRYYWCEARTLIDAFETYFPWIKETSNEDIRHIMKLLKDKLDYTLVNGSLNQELVKQQY